MNVTPEHGGAPGFLSNIRYSGVRYKGVRLHLHVNWLVGLRRLPPLAIMDDHSSPATLLMLRVCACARKCWCTQVLVHASAGAHERWCTQVLVRTSAGARKCWCTQVLVRTSAGARKCWESFQYIMAHILLK